MYSSETYIRLKWSHVKNLSLEIIVTLMCLCLMGSVCFLDKVRSETDFCLCPQHQICSHQ